MIVSLEILSVNFLAKEIYDMVNNEEGISKKEEVKVVANFKPIQVKADVSGGPVAKCHNCGIEKPVKHMNYGNLKEVGNSYLCWSCNGKPYVHCTGIEGCPKGGCIHRWEDMEWLCNGVNWKDVRITGTECISFSNTEICLEKLHKLIEFGNVFQCTKCNLYYVKELTASEYFGAVGIDNVCAVCYDQEHKDCKGTGEKLG